MRTACTNRTRVVTTLAGIVLANFGFTSATQAALVNGSEGRVNLIGNDASAATGSFSVDVAYEVYDGTSASDPLGANGSLQLAFALLHNGSGGESPVLNFSRFFVHAPVGALISPFYTSIANLDPAAGTFLIGPNGNEIDPSGGIQPHVSAGTAQNITASPNRARFSFTGPGSVADFQPGQYSRLLVLTVAPANLPANVILEIDGTNTSPSIHTDTTVSLVPEPSAVMLSLAAGAFALLRKPKARA